VETVPDSAVTVTQGLLVVKSITAYDLQSKTLLGHQVQSVLYVHAYLLTNGWRTEYDTLRASIRSTILMFLFS
jgi:hypothetical protein